MNSSNNKLKSSNLQNNSHGCVIFTPQIILWAHYKAVKTLVQIVLIIT